jgi:hypothetical protein
MKQPALGRPMDLTYPSNVFVLIATPVIGTIAGVSALVAGESMWDSAWWGYSAAGAGFLAWTIAREMHPDRAWVAAVATLGAPWGVLIVRPDLISVAVVLLVVRAVADTTGRALRLSDLILLVVVGGIAALRDPAPGVLALGALGLTLVAIWSERGRRWAGTTAILYVIGASAAALVGDGVTPTGEGWIVLAVGSVAGLVSLLGPRTVTVGTDRPGGVIDPGRIRIARLLGLAMVPAAAVTADPGVMFPLVATLAAVALRPR